MRSIPRAALAAALALAAGSAAHADLLFNFRFDDTFDYPDIGTPLNGAIIGTGSIRIPSDPGNGVFSLSELGAVTISFTFPDAGLTFTEADLFTDSADLFFGIFDYGATRSLQIAGPSDGSVGAFGGSPSFFNGGQFLDFEPFDVGGFIDSFFLGTDTEVIAAGSYLGLQAPEPSSAALLALGAIGGAIARRRRSAKASLRRAA